MVDTKHGQTKHHLTVESSGLKAEMEESELSLAELSQCKQGAWGHWLYVDWEAELSCKSTISFYCPIVVLTFSRDQLKVEITDSRLSRHSVEEWGAWKFCSTILLFLKLGPCVKQNVSFGNSVLHILHWNRTNKLYSMYCLINITIWAHRNTL